MRQRVLTCLLAVLVTTAARHAFAQALVNPDISAIADMRYVVRNDVARELANARRTSFEFQELELAINSYLNPYSRADLYVSTALEGPVEVEEVYAILLRGLPVQARFGKFKLDVGKINTQHAHQWGWMETPLMLRSFLGPDGAAAEAVNVSRLQPVGESAVTLSLSAFRAGFFGQEDAAGDTTEAGDATPKIGYTGRLSFFRSLTDFSHLEVGASYLFATYDPSSALDTQLGGLDVKFKWRPDAYRSFTAVAEAMLDKRDVEDRATQTVSTVTAGGAFGAAELKFRKRFDVGAYVDWAQDAVIDGVQTTAGGAYVGFMPVEETIRFSVLYRHETSDFYDGGSDSVNLQVLWAVGPHKPHQF